MSVNEINEQGPTATAPAGDRQRQFWFLDAQAF
jgi:hypothetical protein